VGSLIKSGVKKWFDSNKVGDCRKFPGSDFRSMDRIKIKDNLSSYPACFKRLDRINPIQPVSDGWIG
jgi:hypothetical protein